MKKLIAPTCLVAILLCASPSVRGADTLPDAAARGAVSEVRRLLDEGVPVDTRKANTGWTALISAVRSGKTDVVKLLLERGAKPDLASATGYTPLMAATQTRNAPLIRLLLLRGANANKSTPQGLTPLMVAAGNKADSRTEAADLESVKLLLRGGADPERLHKSGATALAVAEAGGKTQVAAYLRRMVGGGSASDAVIARDGILAGSVAYRERIAVSPAAFSVVRLLDVAPKSPVVIAQTVTPFAGKQVPVAFSLPYTGAAIGKRYNPRFALDARIVSGSTVQYRTAKPVPVLQSAGASKNVPLLLTRADEQTASALTAEAIATTDKALTISGQTRTGTTRVGEIVTSYEAMYLGGRLARIVARSTQGDYGNRTDRYYFSEAIDSGGVPMLRGAFLSAKRAARTQPPVNGGGETQIIPGKFEQVNQRIFLSDNGDTISTMKTVDGENREVSPLDITAARNFARLLAVRAIGSINRSR
ncbi:MAG: ankyrin repeat domain-containing protein [Armatimonadetes bacterium]|nr:ankyrin repeat domain-containing protein [Armatimonadota bacterium]